MRRNAQYPHHMRAATWEGGVLAGSRQSCGAGHVGQQEVALYNIVVFFLFFSLLLTFLSLYI